MRTMVCWAGVALLSIVVEISVEAAYITRTVGITDDPCGPTLDAMRAQGETGLPRSPYIPPPPPKTANFGQYNTYYGYNAGQQGGSMSAYDYGFHGGAGQHQAQMQGVLPQPTSIPGIESYRYGNVFSASPMPQPARSESAASVARRRIEAIGSVDPTVASRTQGSGGNPNLAVGQRQPAAVDSRIASNTNIGAGTGNVPRLTFSLRENQAAAPTGRRFKRQVVGGPGGYNTGAYNQAPMYDYDPPEYPMAGQQTHGAYGQQHMALDIDMPPGGFPAQYGAQQPGYAYDVDYPVGYQPGQIDPQTAAAMDIDIPPGLQQPPPGQHQMRYQPLNMRPIGYPPPPRQTQMRNPFFPQRFPQSPVRPSSPNHRLQISPTYSFPRFESNPGIYARQQLGRVQPAPTFRQYRGAQTETYQRGPTIPQHSSNAGQPARSPSPTYLRSSSNTQSNPNPGQPTRSQSQAGTRTWSEQQANPRAAANSQNRQRTASIDVTSRPQTTVLPSVDFNNPSTTVATLTDRVQTGSGTSGVAIDTPATLNNAASGASAADGTRSAAANTAATAGQSLNSVQDRFVAKINLQPSAADLANGKHAGSQSHSGSSGATAVYPSSPAEPLPTNPAPIQEPAYQNVQYDTYGNQYQDPYYQDQYYQPDPYAYDYGLFGSLFDWFFGQSATNQGYQSGNSYYTDTSGYQSQWPEAYGGGANAGNQGRTVAVSNPEPSHNQAVGTSGYSAVSTAGGEGHSDTAQSHGTVSIVERPAPGGNVMNRPPNPQPTYPAPTPTGQQPIPQRQGAAYTQGTYSQYQQEQYPAYQQNSYYQYQQDPYAAQTNPYNQYQHQQPAAVDQTQQDPPTCYCELAHECNTFQARMDGAHYNRQCDGRGNFVCCCRR